MLLKTKIVFCLRNDPNCGKPKKLKHLKPDFYQFSQEWHMSDLNVFQKHNFLVSESKKNEGWFWGFLSSKKTIKYWRLVNT